MDALSARPLGIALTERQRIAWLRLIRSDNVGPATFRDLVNHFASAETALAALPELSARGGATLSIRIATESEAHKELEAARRFGARFVGIGEPEYTQALKQVDVRRRCLPSKAISPSLRSLASVSSAPAMPPSAAPSSPPRLRATAAEPAMSWSPALRAA